MALDYRTPAIMASASGSRPAALERTWFPQLGCHPRRSLPSIAIARTRSEANMSCRLCIHSSLREGSQVCQSSFVMCTEFTILRDGEVTCAPMRKIYDYPIGIAISSTQGQAGEDLLRERAGKDATSSTSSTANSPTRLAVRQPCAVPCYEIISRSVGAAATLTSARSYRHRRQKTI